MAFVLVKEWEDSDEYVKLPLKHNRLTLITLKETFSGSAGLLYRSGTELNAVGLLSGDDTLAEPFFEEPESGWANKTFFMKIGSRPTAPIGKGTLSKWKSRHSAHEYLEKVLPYLYRFKKNESFNTELSGSGTAISKNLIVTCAHVLFGLDQYTKIVPNTVLPPNENYFNATNNEGKTFKLLLISLLVKNDLAILKVVGDEPLVTEEPLIRMPLRCAFHYMIPGYSKFDGFALNKELPAKRDEGIKSAWSIVEGIVSHHINDGCYAGHGGAAPGMSGGPVLGHHRLGLNYEDFAGCPAIDLDNFGPVLFGICRGGIKGYNTGTLPIVHIIPMSIILSVVNECKFLEEVTEEELDETGSTDSNE